MERLSLAGSARRLIRAAEHANSIADVLDRLVSDPSTQPYIYVSEEELNGEGDVDVTLDFSYIEAARRSNLEVVASETLFNIRAALDYVVFEVAWLDAGHEVNNTQFPIVSERAKWRDESRRRLRGFTREHVEAVFPFQPFAGCGWSRQLQSLTNADKHRRLLKLLPAGEGMWNLSLMTFEQVQGEAGRLRAPVRDVDLTVEFADGTDCFASFQTMIEGAAQVHAAFAALFGEAGRLSLEFGSSAD
jgi:hypothetical protein